MTLTPKQTMRFAQQLADLAPDVRALVIEIAAGLGGDLPKRQYTKRAPARSAADFAERVHANLEALPGKVGKAIKKAAARSDAEIPVDRVVMPEVD